MLNDTKINENLKLPWNNKSEDESYKKYIEQLTEDEQEQLLSKYEADFTMFGYSVVLGINRCQREETKIWGKFLQAEEIICSIWAKGL